MKSFPILDCMMHWQVQSSPVQSSFSRKMHCVHRYHKGRCHKGRDEALNCLQFNIQSILYFTLLFSLYVWPLKKCCCLYTVKSFLFRCCRLLSLDWLGCIVNCVAALVFIPMVLHCFGYTQNRGFANLYIYTKEGTLTRNARYIFCR